MAQPRDAKSSNGELNYFTCTLDQAAKLNETRPNPFPTIIHLLDKQALDLGHRPAVGLPYRESNGAWTWEVLSTSLPCQLAEDLLILCSISGAQGPLHPSRSPYRAAPSGASSRGFAMS